MSRYTTFCDICQNPVTKCECARGPTLPLSNELLPVDEGYSPRLSTVDRYRQALRAILDAQTKRKMRMLAQEALDAPE